MSDIKNGAWYPWNHPLRLEAEKMVQRYFDFAQSHLPSDNARELVEVLLRFRMAEVPGLQPDEPLGPWEKPGPMPEPTQ